MDVLTFQNLGTVSDFIGATGAIGHTTENVIGDADRVVIHMRKSDKDTNPARALLSPTLSKMLRAKEIGKGVIPTLELALGSNGIYYITRKQSEIHWDEVKSLKVRELPTVNVNHQELIAL